MKTSTKYIALCTAAALLGTACTSLDLNPLDNPSAETWYDDGPKIEMSLNTLLLLCEIALMLYAPPYWQLWCTLITAGVVAFNIRGVWQMALRFLRRA